jgi:broad specificity phosphatase PhoE
MEISKSSTFVSPSSRELPLKIIFVRHGEAGQTIRTPSRGPILTELGRRQAERVARRLSDMDIRHMYCSTLERAESTAEIIHVYHRNVTLTETDDIREVSHFHFLSDLTPDDKAVKEQIREEKDSLTRFINLIRHTHNPGETICVVCHGNCIRTLLPMFGGKDPGTGLLIEINNCSVTILDTSDTGDFVLILSDCVRHLLERQVT